MIQDLKIGDRMKNYENEFCSIMLDTNKPIIVRLDGKGFSKFTKSLKKPFDDRLSMLMIETAKYLLKETNANCAYTQSDEITLLIYNDNPESNTYFNGRYFKITSDLAAMCSVFFNSKLSEYIPEKSEKLPRFDCRPFNVPTLEEATNCFLWREKDAVKNSVSMAAQSVYSHNSLIGVNTDIKKDMLMSKDINWDDYPSYFKNGTYIRRKRIFKPFSDFEISKLPINHNARKNPNMLVERWEISTEYGYSLMNKEMNEKINFIINNK